MNEARTSGTIRSTGGLSCGRRTRSRIDPDAASLAVLDERLVQPRRHGSAPSTTADRLSGIIAAKMPPKNSHAATHPSITF